MTLDVESGVTRGSGLEAEEGRDASDAVELRHPGGYADKARGWSWGNLYIRV